MAALPFLVTGATGRIGRALRAGWAPEGHPGLRPVWQAREARPGFVDWDILHAPCPEGAASGVVLALAGGKAAGEANTDLALATMQAARDQGARHVFLMSSSAVYGASDTRLSEDTPPAPLAAYGLQKLAMEHAAQSFADSAALGLTVLRLGNVAGFDALLGGVRPGRPVVLDPVPGAQGGPMRSYIGPVSLGRVLAGLAALAAAGAPLPEVLNIAAPAPVRMGALLDAAGIDWRYGPENPGVLPRVVLDTGRLQALHPLPARTATAGELVAEWREVMP